MKNQEIQVSNDTAYFPASSAYLRPRYPIDPQLSEPLAEALGKAYASTALVSLLILLVSFSILAAAASVSHRPVSADHGKTGQQLEQVVEPVVLTAHVPVTAR